MVSLRPMLQELWCKKVPPSQAQVPACQLQHLTPPAGDSDESSPLPDLALTAKLTEAADALGVLLQNRHQGFLHNRRQQRMGGLAAIELAQKVRQLVGAGPAACSVLASVSLCTWKESAATAFAGGITPVYGSALLSSASPFRVPPTGRANVGFVS